jgi:Carboxylesterase family
MGCMADSKKVQAKRNRLRFAVGATILIAFAGAGVARAQVPADIEAGLVKIGHIVDPICTAKLYRPLMPTNDISSNVTPLYAGITIARDQSFGPDPKDVVDIFTADKGGAKRPVLIYVPGGAGNKIEPGKEPAAFFDNIGRWATENGMVGVLMQRHAGAGDYYAGAKDVSAMLQWVEANISKYKGNPSRMFMWAHSAGNGPVGIYLGHPELYGPNGVGVKGIVFMSGQFNILRPDGTNPVPPPPGGPEGGGAGPAARAGMACGAAPAGGPGAAGGPGGGAGPGGAGRAATPPSQDELVKRSSLSEIEKTKVKIFLASAELDPGVNGTMSPFNQALHDELCKAGPDHCPVVLFEKGESHMGEVFSIDTPDKSVSGPILAWMKKTK